ncbi:MAG: alpha/beta fold hydrolase [Planctomycetota bacterium]
MPNLRIHAGAVALVALMLTGCNLEQMMVDAFTGAPNGGRDAVDPDRGGPSIFDGLGTVDTPGPPPVTLAYWIMEPGPTHIAVVPGEEQEQDTPDDEDAPATPAVGPVGWRTAESKPGKDGGFVRTWRAPSDTLPDDPAPAAATVVVIRGWGADVRGDGYLWHLSAALADAGCRVVSVDLRGHGDSTGDIVTSGFREVEDLAALLDHLDRRGLLDGPVGVLGHSYGGGIAVQFAAHDPRVRRVLALSPLVDIRPAMLPGVRAFARSQRPLSYFFYLQFVLTPEKIERVQAQMEQRTGADLSRNNALARVEEIDVPILILQSDPDIATPLAGAEKLRDANPDRVELIVYPDGGHSSYLRKRWPQVEPTLRTWAAGLVAMSDATHTTALSKQGN